MAGQINSESYRHEAPLLVIGAAAIELTGTAELLRELPADLPSPVLLAMHSFSESQSSAALEKLSASQLRVLWI